MALSLTIPQLCASIDGKPSGELLMHSIFEFRYSSPSPDQARVALLMPAQQMTS